MKVTKLIKQQIITFFELGVSPGDISDLTGVSLLDLTKLCDSDSQIGAAKRIGEKAANIKVLEALYKAATGYDTFEQEVSKRFGKDGKSIIFKETKDITKTFGPNVSAIKFFLENRDKEWKDSMKDVESKMNIKITVAGKEIIVSNDTNEEK